MPKPAVGRWPYVPTYAQAFKLRKRRKRRMYRDTAALVFLAGSGLMSRRSFITIRGPSDGGGSQVLRALQARAFCANFGLRYADSPPVAMEHARSADEVRKWLEVFRPGHGAPEAANVGLPVVPLSVFVRLPFLWPIPCVVAVRKLYPYIDANPEVLGLVRDSAIDAFAPRVTEDENAGAEVRAAVHVRRGDVSATQYAKKRYSPDEAVLRGIERIRAIAAGRPLSITLFSQGAPEDFDAFQAPDIRLQLNGDAVDDLCLMARADILLIARRSAYSFLAAFYNRNGTILYEPPGFMPQSGWIAI